MFRGSYLIEKVKHTITPGDMKTTFTGVRMANTSTRIAKNWIKKAYNPQSISLSSVATAFGISGGNGYSSDGTYVGNGGVSGDNIPHPSGKLPFVGKSDKEKFAMCGVNLNWTNAYEAKKAGLIVDAAIPLSNGERTFPMNKYIVDDLRDICKEILSLGWFHLDATNVWREKSTAKHSRHFYGCAIDICIN